MSGTKQQSSRRSWPSYSRFPLEWGPWPIWLALAVYIAAMTGSIVAGLAAFLIPQNLQASWLPVLQQTFFGCVAIAVPMVVIRRFAPGHLGLRTAPWVRVLGSVAVFMAIFTGVELLWRALANRPNDTAQQLQDMGVGQSFAAELGIIAAVTILAPVAEELIFRGLIYRSLRDAIGRWSRPVGMAVAAVISALLFADIHAGEEVDIGLTAMYVLMALLFIALYEWSGSLLTPILAHSVNNAFAVFLGIQGGAEPTTPLVLALLFLAPLCAIGIALGLTRVLPTFGDTQKS